MIYTQFFLELELPDVNEMIGLAGSTHKDHQGRRLRGTLYSDMKKKYMADAALLIRQYYRSQGIVMPALSPTERVQIRFDWYERDRRRDPDNISGCGRKIILDAAQSIGLIPHDGWKLYRENELAILESFHVAHWPRQKTGVLVTISTPPTQKEDQAHEEEAGQACV